MDETPAGLTMRFLFVSVLGDEPDCGLDLDGSAIGGGGGSADLGSGACSTGSFG